MAYILMILVGYLLGCSNLAYYIAKAKKVDLSRGSGNPGTSNAAILMGWGAGIAVGAHDIGKAFLSVLLAKLLFPGVFGIGEVAGVACVLGHIFPFWLKFKGGKGFAPFLGMTLGLNWWFALILMAAVLVILFVTDFMVISTFTSIVAVPVFIGIWEKSWILAAILLVATLTIFFRHWENIGRLLNGTEIGLRSTAKGDHRK